MTVYAGDVIEQFNALSTSLDAVDLSTATAAELAALVRASRALAEAASALLATLDASMPTQAAGGLLEATEGVEALTLGEALVDLLADLEQVQRLHALAGYGGRLTTNLGEVVKLR